MLKFIFILVALFFFWIHNAKKKKSYLCSSSVLLGIYVVSAFFCIPALFIGEYKEPYSPSYWLPSLLFLAFLILLLIPAKSFRDDSVKQLVLPNRSTLSVLATVIIVLSFSSIIYYSGTVSNIFAMNLNDARTDLYLGEEYVEGGIVNTIASVSASLYVFALLLFFIYLTIPSSKVVRILLLISSLSEPLHILAYVGRDGVVFWLFSFVFLYSIFRPFLEPKAKSFLKRVFIVSAIVLAVPFLLITMSRFGADGANRQGAFDSIINYWGQGYIQGTLFIGIKDTPYSYGVSFPLFFEITGISRPQFMGEMIQIGDWRSWFFGTIVTDLIRNFGYVGFLAYVILCILLFHGVMKIKSGRLCFHQIIYYILYFQIMSQGVFYFRQYTRGGNFFIILSLLLVLIFNFTITLDHATRVNLKV